MTREDDAKAIATRAHELRETAEALRSVNEEDLRALVAAMTALTQDEALRQALCLSTGLSRAVVAFGLESTFETFDLPRVLAIRAQAPEFAQNRTQLAAVVLAGNVFTAGARALLVPLILGVPVLAKASSRDAVFPQALAAALPARFQPSLHVCAFPGGSEAEERALLADAEVVHVYGSDATLFALRQRTPAHALFVPHGHGLGVAYVDGFTDEDVAGLAEDVAAYDQRGCMSPMEVVVKGGAADAERFARALHTALDELDVRWPRGALSPAVATAQAQWRGVVMAAGALFEGAGHAVGLEQAKTLPRGPGARNVLVSATLGHEGAETRWRALGASLKTLGVSQACLARGDFPRTRGTAPRVCALGQMQRPAFDALADGRKAHEGLIWRSDR